MVDVVILGAGPSGIFTALELLTLKTEKKILMIDEGHAIEKRHCPKDKTGQCVSCQPSCNITTGFSGAGAFSDGKLSLSVDVGGELPELIGTEYAQELIDYTDGIYLQFGADPKVEGVKDTEAIKEIRKKAIRAGLKLVDCPIRHLGTEQAQLIYKRIEQYLLDEGVEMLFESRGVDLLIENGEAKGVCVVGTDGVQRTIMAKHVVVATGRKGAGWLEEMCIRHGINRSSGTVDIGVRVEVRNEVMEEVNNVLYESKLIGYPQPFGNKVRTFCQNPGGFVAQENYDDHLALVNGHSYKKLKSENTNLAILCSHHFTSPFDQPIDYAKRVGELCNMLGDGHILVQRFGDILEGKRTWQKELERSNVRPTLKDAVAGDITACLPYRTMVNIISFMQLADQVVPGFASTETLLYAPEIKFYSNKVALDQQLRTNILHLYALGDSSGHTRGLMMASAMGVLMGRILHKM